MRIDAKIMLIQYIVTEILTKTRFLVMAVLICILCGLSKDDRVASLRFFKSILQRYGNSKKKVCTDPIARLSKNLESGNRTKRI
jgi:hypothetical protein